MVMLTTKRVEREKRPGRYRDGHIRGLYLQIGPTGGKSWLLRFERDGRERWLGLGPLDVVDLKTARERARAARLLLLDGVDPIDHRKAERAKLAAAKAKLLIFREAAEQFFNQHEGKWKNAKHRTQFTNTLKQYAFPVLGDMAISDIGVPEVLRAIEPSWHSKTETMSRVRGRIEAILDWATVRGYRTGDNPARWKGLLSQALPARGQIKKTNHHAAMPYAELPAFMIELRKREGVAARALEFGILTAARSGEVIGARWNEISFKDKTWTVPANCMKGGKTHVVPLSERAMELLGALPKEDGNDFVFVGARPGTALGAQALVQVVKRMHSEITVHGMRSSFRDGCSETTNFPNHICEMALAHAIPNAVEASYRRGNLLVKRKALMEAWSKYCTSPPPAGAVVVPMRKGAQA
jgi:integrase